MIITSRTPMLEFLEDYLKRDSVRLHMPGHKGSGFLGEWLDITEIDGADSLFEANGIIRKSEKLAGDIFSADTFYSTEGSSLSIRAMLYLVTVYAKSIGKRPLIAAARNAHKSFVSAAALIDFDVDWICSDRTSFLSAKFSAWDITEYFDSKDELPVAVYLTSPDYLGFISDIEGIAKECHKRGVLLMVDNAHGAYLKFLSQSLHPIDLGADICCDSAHKTLSALTGCGYLHLSKSLPSFFKERAKNAMMLFASTSPSYLMLASLDSLNAELTQGFAAKLKDFAEKLALLKADLISHGYELVGDEPMKISIKAKSFGYTGRQLSELLLREEIYTEFSDSDYLVLMPSPKNSDEDLSRLKKALLAIPKKEEINAPVPQAHIPKMAVSIRDAVISDSELLPVRECIGRVAAMVTASCPPAIPIAVSGEIIDAETVKAFEYYAIDKCSVMKE